ncbi:MAG: three-Cys-motif partner protein TcmP [Acidobacteriota bacterium]|nr:three-Cys-motif partner protein TcmP [Acidobacteriota bacterium]MDE2927633.1 three-Cys-motif partner protein TcmP [Acidobacteriota bacterium]
MNFSWHPDESPPLIEAHSKAKLDVLRSYLHAYLDRLNINPHREEFKLDLVDGFAGGGTFLDGKEVVSGSPLIMLEESEKAKGRLNRRRTNPLRFDFGYYFVDKEAAHIGHLKKVLDERGYQVDGERIVVINKRFEEVLDDIIAKIRRRQPRAGRSIFLLDQTGFAQVALELVARIFRELPAAEVILTFATDALVNHLAETRSQIKAVAPIDLSEAQIRELIEYRDGDGGRALIQRTLRNHIRTGTRATYDTPFFIRPRRSRRALWFLHLSRHPTARDVMIQRHWEISNTFEHYGPGDFGMLGWEGLHSKTLPLFHFTGHDAEQMRSELLNSLPEKLFGLVSETPITVDTMRHMLANKTAARFSDLDEAVLQLFRERELRILDPDGKVRSHTLRRLRPSDQIALPNTLLLPGISRRR